MTPRRSRYAHTEHPGASIHQHGTHLVLIEYACVPGVQVPPRAKVQKSTTYGPLVLSGSTFERVNGRYVRVDALPADAKAKPHNGYPIWRNESHEEVYIQRVEHRWWISHYQPATADYYHTQYPTPKEFRDLSTREIPWKWMRYDGKTPKKDQLRVEFE